MRQYICDRAAGAIYFFSLNLLNRRGRAFEFSRAIEADRTALNAVRAIEADRTALNAVRAISGVVRFTI
jgi:hypothetical protein